MEMHQLKAFIAVAESGGFAPAAAGLDIAPSSITRSVANLEASLGVRLFQRTTRSVTLTEEGDNFLQRIRPALDEIDAARDQVNNKDEKVTGHLRVAASVSFGQCILAPRLIEFSKRYPEVDIDLQLADSVTDLIAERIDVAIRHGSLNDSTLVAQRLCDVHYRLVAAPDYLQEAKKLSRPADIVKHKCLTFPYQSFRSSWWFSRRDKWVEIPLEPAMRVSNAAALAEAVKSGMGVALLPDWLVDRDIAAGRLTHLLPGWSASGDADDQYPALWIVMPSRQFVPQKTQVFSRFVKTLVVDWQTPHR